MTCVTECEPVLNGQLEGITCQLCQETRHIHCANIDSERVKTVQTAPSEDFFFIYFFTFHPRWSRLGNVFAVPCRLL